MLTITNTEVHGLERALRASGNAMTTGEINTLEDSQLYSKALARGMALGTNPAGSAHDHYLCGIIVQFDILYPQYWAPEAGRYHWFEIITSQSTMHRLAASLADGKDPFNKYVDPSAKIIVAKWVRAYNEAPCYENFMRLRSNLPAGYEMWETITTNYLQLKTMYAQRRNHKLIEDWGAFCDWCESLPLFKELTQKPKLAL